MDNRKDIPVSEMDDRTLQIHALGVAYRDAERRREEAEQREEKLRREIQDLEAQLKDMTSAYQALMAKNTELAASLRKQNQETEELQEKQERGQDQ